jgi:hypothetical protein
MRPALPASARAPQPGGSVREPCPRPGALDLLFAVFVAALGFLLAGTPARNSDLWLHLASGRLLASGGPVPSGTDPFTSTAAGVTWVNHSWLWDVLLYRLHEPGGGRALVVGKAVLVAVLAGVIFCFRRRGTRVGLLALAAVATLIALGPWLVLQPALVSLLGVVLTLYLLERPALVAENAARARALRWLLVPLFALWANLDGWFLLGPLLVGLYALGELLRRLLGARTPGEVRNLVLLTLAGLAACLLTPYHYRTFAWPTPLGLTDAEQALLRDPLGRGLLVSPFGARFAASPVFASPGAWAYYLLLVAGAASFWLCRRSLHPGRLLAWLALAALSVYQAHAIPFFAVAAGPVLALNLQDWARQATLTEPLRRLQFAARGAGVLAGLALLVLAWPGWLQPRPYQARGWDVEPDGSLVRLAKVLEKWHAEGQFRADRFALTFSPEAAQHLAWFCPAEKGFLDSRWPLFARAADDFVQMRSYLLHSARPGPDPELGPLLDAYHIDRLILFDPDWERTTRAYRCLLLGQPEWELLAVEGGATLFGRRSSNAPFPWKPYDHRRAAYRPDPDRRAPLEAPRAPRPPGPFAPFYARDHRSADRSEAALHLIYFDLMAERIWLLAQATGLAGAGPALQEAGPAGTASALAMRLQLTPLLAPAFLAQHHAGPPEALLLAVRAARRALAANPDDAGAYLLLGETYFRLARQARGQGWSDALPSLAAIRHIQVLTALEQAVLLRPELDQAHDLLAQLYYEAGQMDRALDHLRARLALAEQQAKKRGPAAAAARERLTALQDAVEALESIVRRSRDVYEANAAALADPSKVYARARLACRHGLSRKGLEMLQASYPAVFGKAGTQLQLDLMLQAGRAFEVRAWLEPEFQTALGHTLYHWLQAQAAAACGASAAADEELDSNAENLRQVRLSAKRVVPVRSAVALRVADAVLARPVREAGLVGLVVTLSQQSNALRPLVGISTPTAPTPAGLLRQEADSLVLRGLLALEAGEVEVARRHLGAALAVWGSASRAAQGAGVDFAARPLAQQALRWLQESGTKDGG